jgi:hypothetical protein
VGHVSHLFKLSSPLLNMFIAHIIHNLRHGGV